MPSPSMTIGDDAPFAFAPPRGPGGRGTKGPRDTQADRPAPRATTLRPSAAPDRADGGQVEALRIVVYTGFGILGTVLGHVFLPPAGVALSLIVALKGFGRVYGTYGTPGLRAISLVCFSAFAVVATAMGFAFLPPAGVLLAAICLWKGFGETMDRKAGTDPSDIGPRPTGNAAFDTCRDRTLRRLTQEQTDFEDFLDRLRRARDRSQFDRFLEARDRAAGPPSA